MSRQPLRGDEEELAAERDNQDDENEGTWIADDKRPPFAHSLTPSSPLPLEIGSGRLDALLSRVEGAGDLDSSYV